MVNNRGGNRRPAGKKGHDMTHEEFTKISGQKVSFGVYAKTFEPMYMATSMGKQEFINFMMPTIKAVAKAERDVRERAAAQQIGRVYLIRHTDSNGGALTDEAEVIKVSEVSGRMTVRYTGNFGVYLNPGHGKTLRKYNEVHKVS